MQNTSRILIVDDNEVNRIVLHDLITALGHKPLLAENGVVALDYVRKERIDVILLDILMPQMDGFEMLKIVKNDKDFHHIPVIMITAVNEIGSIVQCIENGADDYEIMKQHVPIGGRTLREVEQQCPGNEFIRAGIEIVESHHECWNGTGYPRGLTGEDIPLMGRIVTLADVHDAITSKRVYKEPIPHEACFEMIIQGKERHVDPDIANAFIATESEFKSIKEHFADNKEMG